MPPVGSMRERLATRSNSLSGCGPGAWADGYWMAPDQEERPLTHRSLSAPRRSGKTHGVVPRSRPCTAANSAAMRSKRDKIQRALPRDRLARMSAPGPLHPIQARGNRDDWIPPLPTVTPAD
jgi:hypothetical protein